MALRLPYADADALRRAYAFDNLQSFLDLFYLGLTVLQTGDDFYQMTDRLSRRARRARTCATPRCSSARRRICAAALPIEPIIDNILAAFDDAHAGAMASPAG